jgi:hypothetical protein
MALSVQFFKGFNRMTDQYIVTPRLVNQQTLEYNKLCDYLADGSTVTATDVSAVMKQIEKKLPFLVGLNVKAICSPEGLTFRPAISGSITQAQLKAKLEARKAAETDPEKADKINVDREIQTSDLTVSDLTASIVIDLPKKWVDRFHSEAEFIRVAKSAAGGDTTVGGDGNGGSTDNSGTTDNSGSGSTVNGSGSTDNSGSTESGNGGSTENPVNPETPAGETYSIQAGVGSDGGGSVTIKKNGAVVEGSSVQASASDTVVLQAVPENANFQFMSWSDGNSQNPRTIQPSADMNVTANFLDLSKI